MNIYYFKYVKSLFLLLALIWSVCVSRAEAIGTGFSYQGRLTYNNSPTNGLFDFKFDLYAVQKGGKPIASVLKHAVKVANGMFGTELDFGDVFTGSILWVQVSVKPSSSNEDFVLLEPRERIEPTPNSLYAVRAGHAESVAGANITGTIPVGAIPPEVPVKDKTNVYSGLNTFLGKANLLSYDNVIFANTLTASNSISVLNGPQHSKFTLGSETILWTNGGWGLSPVLNVSLNGTNSAFISQRSLFDEFSNNEEDIKSGIIGVYAPDSILALTHFKYGADIAFRNPSNELEFHGFSIKGNRYVPILALLPHNDFNITQFRHPHDTNSLYIGYFKDAPPYISTEKPGTDMVVKPTGNLLLGANADHQWVMTSTNFVPRNDNLYDFGSGMNRARNIFAGGVISASQGFREDIKRISSSTYKATESDGILISLSPDAVIFIPSSSDLKGKQLVIKNASISSVTIQAGPNDRIDQQSSFTIYTANDSVTLVSDGSEWWSIAGTR